MSRPFECVNHPMFEKNNNKEYKCYINNDTTKLIIGTMPPEFVFNDDSKNRRVIDFFYGSKKNKLWKNLLGNDYTEEDVFEFLDNNKIGIVDIVDSCVYNDKDDNRKGYDDKSLLNIKPNKINELLLKYKNVKILFFTSRFAFELFNIFYTKSFQFFDVKNRIGKLYIDENISYIFYILKSPSGSSRYKNEILKKDYLVLTKKDEDVEDYYYKNFS